MGDAFLDGIQNYSSAHFLHMLSGLNFLAFGASGFGSINAARHMIETHEMYNRSWIFPNLGKPEAIYFYFYAGNDLNNNIDHMKARMAAGESIEQYVNRTIEERSDTWAIDAFFPFASLIYNYVRINLKQIAGNGPPNSAEKSVPNSLSLPDNSVAARTLQSSAAELTEEEIQDSLSVLFHSLKSIQSWSPDSKIIVVYLPSVVGSYVWNEPIEIQKYTSNGIRLITNDDDRRMSDQIRESIRRFCATADFDFVDTTGAIRQLGRTNFVHGPRDWKHFNADGYAVIASEIFARIHKNP
jgi:hypothetical protein